MRASPSTSAARPSGPRFPLFPPGPGWGSGWDRVAGSTRAPCRLPFSSRNRDQHGYPGGRLDARLHFSTGGGVRAHADRSGGAQSAPPMGPSYG
eukprot:8258178-Alexandrium_andersonii.AAC.1